MRAKRFKISIIGAGNVGGLVAMRVVEGNIGDVLLVDIVGNLAQAKALDLEDSLVNKRIDFKIDGTGDISKIKGSDVIVITAGFPRKPGISREQLLIQNGQIVRNIASKIKKLNPASLIIIATNPVDLMTYLVYKITGFNRRNILGMGINLDAARFKNLISQELSVSSSTIRTLVIGSHSGAMLPLPRFTYIGGKPLEDFISSEKLNRIIKRTINRGAEIVDLFGSGSAYFGPSSALVNLIELILYKKNDILGVSCYLDGEYSLKDICIGVPVRLSKYGIKEIIELKLNKKEENLFYKSAESINEGIQILKDKIL